MQTIIPLNAIAFGKADWEKYFGSVGDEPPLPENLQEILQSECPIFPDKKVHETHILTLIPVSVNGHPLTIKKLADLVQSPQRGWVIHSLCLNFRPYQMEYSSVSSYYDNANRKPEVPILFLPPLPRWVLMAKNGFTVDVPSFAKRTCLPYIQASSADAVTSICLHYIKTHETLIRSDSTWITSDNYYISQNAVRAVPCRAVPYDPDGSTIEIQIDHKQPDRRSYYPAVRKL